MSGSDQLRLNTAQEFTEALGQVFAGGMRLAGLADDLGVPAALGLSEQEWLERRLAGEVKLSIDERRAIVAELTSQGMSTRDIEAATGIDHVTAFRDQHAVSDETPDRPETKDPEGQPVSDETPEPEPDRRLGFMLSSASEEWETPQALFDVLDDEFRFDLDVCATPKVAKCEDFLTPEDDGLIQPWFGICWMNPPYGETIGKWVAKAHDAADHGATVVCLLPARVDTGWWWDHCRHGEIRFIRGRLRFGGSDAGAPFPSAVVVFGRPARVVWWEWQ